MKPLSEVEPEVKVAVKKIEGGVEVKGHLEELGRGIWRNWASQKERSLRW
jgi:hypothetical protein